MDSNQNSSAPAVDRGTKPRQTTNSPPSVNRKLKPMLPKVLLRNLLNLYYFKYESLIFLL